MGDGVASGFIEQLGFIRFLIRLYRPKVPFPILRRFLGVTG